MKMINISLVIPSNLKDLFKKLPFMEKVKYLYYSHVSNRKVTIIFGQPPRVIVTKTLPEFNIGKLGYQGYGIKPGSVINITKHFVEVKEL